MVAGEVRQPVVERSESVRIHDEWTQDLDLSLDPDREIVRPGQARSRTGLWMGVGLVAGMGLALVLFGGVGVVLLAGAALGGAFVLFVPAVDVVMPEPVVAEPVVVSAPAPVAPAEVAPAEVAPAAVQRVIPKIAPAAPPVQEPALQEPGEEKVEAELVVMPDPGFRGKPLDKSIEELKKKGDTGKIGVVVGH
jgi:hypothetical protein